MTAISQRSEDILRNLFDSSLEIHGDTPEGALWPNEEDRNTRFRVMLDIIEQSKDERVCVCDLGCGTGELLRYIREQGVQGVEYVGADISARALRFAREKFPEHKFIEIDITAPDARAQELSCDYMIANGLFTVKDRITYRSMWDFMESVLNAVWPHVRKGMAFNVMSKVVDWERSDLFHVPMDDLSRLLHRLAGRRVIYRGDYGLYEYTAYMFKPGAEPITREADYGQ